MAVKKASKQATARKSTGGTPRKRTGKQARAKKSSPGLMSRAKKVVRAVVTGAAGAVQGAVESGKKAAGLGQGSDKGSKS